MFTQVSFDADTDSKLRVHAVDTARGELFFAADGESFADAREQLSDPLNDNFFVAEAKDKLRMASPAVNDRQVYIYDPKTNSIVVPKHGDRLEGYIPIMRVRFIDF